MSGAPGIAVAQGDDQVGVALQKTVPALRQQLLGLAGKTSGLLQTRSQQVLVGNHRQSTGADFQILPWPKQLTPGRRRLKVLVLFEQAKQQSEKLSRRWLQVRTRCALLQTIE